MTRLLERIRHDWPWGLVILGGWLAFPYAAAWGRGKARDDYMREQRSRTSYDSNRFHHPLRQAVELASKEGRASAERRLIALYSRSDLIPRERDQIVLIWTRLRIQFDGAPESDLRVYLSPGEHEQVWWLALEQLADLRKTAGDADGEAELWEAVVDGRLHHPSFDASPFPYAQKWASRTLAEHYLARGDGVKGHAWALRFKYEFDADQDAPCGAWVTAEFDQMEDLLEKTAALAGRSYTREPRDLFAPASKYHRMYGPPWYECAAAVAAGIELAFLGLWIKGRREGLAYPRNPSRPFFWQRRGALARLHLGLYLALITAALAALTPSILNSRFPLYGLDALEVAALGLAHGVLSVPFLGCFIAKPARSA